MMQIDTQILTALIGTLSGLGGTWLGAYLNRKSAYQTAIQLADVERHKYAQGRLWDAKKEAYTLIIGELNVMRKLTQRINDGFTDGEMHEEEYFQSASFHKDNNELWNRYRQLQTTFDNNSLILSDRFKEQFSEWMKDLFYCDEDDIPPILADVHWNAMRKHVPLFVEVAKDEIAPKLPVLTE
ncbi:hypothetical protein SAMN05518849_102126 [Sphingobium sp. AP50]|uniref:hypothetical protein n=1 Tax=Sphingobium sp. AP50 TaxID=1884369 RepID=UPI0008B958FB|nr:hypothetical protein [Sphingobium sp. AP50]SEI99463.1 hypothetical protein SAMN05518849_102126 [Sphingobium sp. AP50]